MAERKHRNRDMQNYVSCTHPQAVRLLTGYFRSWRSLGSNQNSPAKELVFFCIGTTRVPGDCLGPLVGEKLSKKAEQLKQKSIYVTGNVSDPIHALNLAQRHALARQTHPDALMIAVDAGLGLPGQVGTFAMWEGSLFPGIALKKDLPPVGDFGIAGIVGVCGPESFQSLQNASGRMVKKMADRICHAICHI